jgi:transposase
MVKKYVVRLTSEERKKLENMVARGKVAAYRRLHAQVLLKADISDKGPGWTDQKIADAFDITVRSIERIRKRLVEYGLDAAIRRAGGGGRKRLLDGSAEAHLIALACSDPPEGRCQWTLQLLADKMVELRHIDTVSYETVRRVLKKTKSNHGKR